LKAYRVTATKKKGSQASDEFDQIVKEKSLIFDISKSNRYNRLSPCDFDLIPKMKEPLRGIRFRTVPEILQAV